MIREWSILAVSAVLLCGCATTTVPSAMDREAQKPKFNSAYRDMAAYLMGKRGDAIKVPPDRDISARIQLEPTPGILQKRRAEGQYYGEVLTSGPYSDAYVALATVVPVTQYFRLVREVECDTQMWVTLVNPKMIRANPAYVSGISRDQDASFGCEKHFHARFKKGGDPKLAGADGVILDPTSVSDNGERGWFVNQMHVQMTGWAITFDEPSHEDIVRRLKNKAYGSIDIVQLRAVAFWIEKHRATHYSELMKALLPKRGTVAMALEWNHGTVAVAKALASFQDQTNNVLWMDVLKGWETVTDSRLDPRYPVAVAASRNDIVMVAGNALVCSGDVSLVEAVLQIAKKATRLPHKMVAAQVVADMGRPDLIAAMVNHLGGSIHRTYMDAAKGVRTFDCPFKVTYG
jgi:hypothetical protein